MLVKANNFCSNKFNISTEILLLRHTQCMIHCPNIIPVQVIPFIDSDPSVLQFYGAMRLRSSLIWGQNGLYFMQDQSKDDNAISGQ